MRESRDFSRAEVSKKTLPDSNQIGKLVELKIANTKTSGYINVNTNETCDILFHIASGKYGELFAEITLQKEDYSIIRWRTIF